MQDIDYKHKYLKYKSKYSELKIGGTINKKITFAEIKNKFEELKKNNKDLYYNGNTNKILDITQDKYKISNESKKDNYYLKIKYQYIKYIDNNPEKGIFTEQEILIDENLRTGIFGKISTPTYNVEIKEIDNIWILYHSR
jgi:hypothetical protein